MGLGTKITIKTEYGIQFREMNSGGSGSSQEALPVHFGLNAAVKIEWIRLHWPSGITQEIRDIKVNQTIIIEESIDR